MTNDRRRDDRKATRGLRLAQPAARSGAGSGGVIGARSFAGVTVGAHEVLIGAGYRSDGIGFVS
jgi:hypothetical protein